MLRIDDFFWPDSFLNSMIFTDDRLVVDVTVPRCEDRAIVSLTLVFDGVTLSRRCVTEYKGDEKLGNFKKPYVLVDIEVEGAVGKLFELEGITTFGPRAWIDWEIRARSVQIDRAA